MKPRQRTETTRRTLPFVFADNVLSFYAEGVKTYWRTFGLLGQPAVQTVEAWESLQRRYLEALEDALVWPTMALMEGERRSPQQPGKPLLLNPLSFLGFED